MQAQVQRYSNEAGLRDIMIAEKEVVLTFLLQLFSESGDLDRLALGVEQRLLPEPATDRIKDVGA
jgi:hypothetical protein